MDEWSTFADGDDCPDCRATEGHLSKFTKKCYKLEEENNKLRKIVEYHAHSNSEEGILAREVLKEIDQCQ
jgi:hypothetical protein